MGVLHGTSHFFCPWILKKELADHFCAVVKGEIKHYKSQLELECTHLTILHNLSFFKFLWEMSLNFFFNNNYYLKLNFNIITHI